VADIALDEVLPLVRKLAVRKANAFARRCPCVRGERQDVASQLILSFLKRWPQFDPGRASVATFASRLMDAELISILRYRLAQGRQRCALPAPEAGLPPTLIHQFRVDLDRALAPLPRVVRRTASALAWFSTSGAAGALGCSRQIIHKRKHQIRDAMVAAGITSNYFARTGARL
jgi:DNA-directed RNA polymerase specialized sigma24 family protein